MYNNFGFDGEVFESIRQMYNVDSRHYHNFGHVMQMIFFIEDCMEGKVHGFNLHLTSLEKDALTLAILFHDVVYVAGSKTNEYDSWVVCEEYVRKYDLDTSLLPMIKEMILATQHHEYKVDLPNYVKLIIRADLNGFAQEFAKTWKDCVNIFKEFQKFDWVDFQKGQIAFLQGLNERIRCWMPAVAYYNIEKIINTLGVWKPNIAVYPGSFDPFHQGHMNILEKAEKIFDKVIIARGKNPEKGERKFTELPVQLNNRQVDEYEGLLTDYTNSKPYPVTVIRGLRNTTDMAYEQNQYRWMQDLDPELKMILIFCDKEFEHISSSGIRTMSKFKNNKNEKYLL